MNNSTYLRRVTLGFEALAGLALQALAGLALRALAGLVAGLLSLVGGLRWRTLFATGGERGDAEEDERRNACKKCEQAHRIEERRHHRGSRSTELDVV